MYEYSCEVKRVVDGDTVDVVLDLGFDISYSTRVRLYGIDTPESRTRDLDEKARGKMAGTFSKLKDSKGKYGRVLGEIIVDDVNINQLMIKCHLAVAYNGQSKEDIEKEHMCNRDILIEKGIFNPEEIK